MKTFPNRYEMMKHLVKPGATICEIGVFTGEFAEKLMTLQPRTLVLIDPFQGTVGSGDADGNNMKEAFLPAEYVKLSLKAAQHPNMILLRGFSHELLPLIKPETFDAIYIDGDHSYAGVKRDLGIAWTLVKEGGWICGHDYETNFEKTNNRYDFGVKRAVDEFCRSKGLEIRAKGMDGQVSFAIRKTSNFLPYIEATPDRQEYKLTWKPSTSESNEK